MAIYCISDIHGNLGAFHRMLEYIRLQPQDTLIVMGDVIDRGPCGISVLQEIMALPQAAMLLGNHEYMMLDCLRPGSTQKEFQRWQRNGSAPTLAQYEACPAAEQQRILAFLKSLPVSLQLSAGDRDFYLVHGFPGQNVHDAVWNRPFGPHSLSPIPEKHLIIGHTPVPSLLHQSEAELKVQAQSGSWIHIFHGPGFTDIDCGCGHRIPGSALSCLRLEDMAEFYVVTQPGI